MRVEVDAGTFGGYKTLYFVVLQFGDDHAQQQVIAHIDQIGIHTVSVIGRHFIIACAPYIAEKYLFGVGPQRFLGSMNKDGHHIEA